MSDRRPVDRILQVHTRYRQAGGEDEVVDAERTLLQKAGIQVSQVIFDNDALNEGESVLGDLRLAASAVWSRSAEQRVRDELIARRAQVMHVHNTFAAASPSIYAAAAARNVPVVQTLHNYRFVCPAATAFRDGHPCTDCVGRPIPWPAVVHACVHGSRRRSAVVAATLTLHRARSRRSDPIAAYVALSEFQRRVMIDGGLPRDRIVVIPNFLDPDPGYQAGDRSGVLFVGRLVREKGVGPLLDAASEFPGLVTIVGDGPLAARAEEAHALRRVTYLGRLPRPGVVANVRKSIAVVIPSIWFEGLPLVLLEAYAAGTPVIASRIGSLAELVEDGVTGLLAEPGNGRDLADRLRWASEHAPEMRSMGVQARERYESRYGAARHLSGLLDTYASVARDAAA